MIIHLAGAQPGAGLSVADDNMTPMSDANGLRVEAVTPGNVEAACRLSVRPDQQEFVAPVAWSLAQAYASPDVAWPRLICRGEDVVGFIMGSFDPGNEWVPGPGGPGPFYERLGFVPTGEQFHGEIVGALALDAA
jgi:diamine N-acetyltransferase